MRSTKLIASVLLVCLGMFAQSDRGTITGTVVDPAGAIVANAQIEARSLETGAVYPAASTTTGNYTLAQLPVGTYELSASVPGFKKYLRRGITVQVADTLRIDITLEVGSATESVTITADAPLLKTESGDLSQNVATARLDELPILGIGSVNAGSSQIRNPYAVTSLVSGSYYSPNNTVKINGAPANQQVYRVEGQDATLGYANWTTAEVQPSVDAIQETAIQTSNYAAEYGGGGGGGVFNVTMKSGNNQYHGTGYDYLINEAFNAGQPFTNDGAGHLVRQRNRRNDFGGTLGGPVVIPKIYNGHDKTFFFFNFEQLIGNDIVANTPQTVPTMAYRLGDFSHALGKVLGTDPSGNTISENQIYDPNSNQIVAGKLVRTPFQGNMIPMSRLDKVALAIQSYIPLPQISAPVNNLTPVFPTDRNTMIPSLKIDQYFSSKDKLSFYWSQTGTDSQYSNTTGGADGLPQPISSAIGTFIHSWVVRANYDRTISPTILLHLGAGYQHLFFNQDPPTRNFNPTTALGLQGPFSPKLFPELVNLGSATLGGLKAPNGNIGPAADAYNWMEKPTAVASLMWVRSNHTYKFGGEMRVEGYPTKFFTGTDGVFTFSAAETGLPYLNATTLAGGSVGFPYASFLLGQVDAFNIVPVNSPKFGKQQWGVFIQDTWKVARNFTLDYGIRWDYGTYEKEQYGRLATLSPTTPNPSAGGFPGAVIFEGSGPGRCNCNFAHNYPYAIGPRLGAAYQFAPKTVLRAGIGVVYSSTPENNQTTGRASPNYTTISPAFGTATMTFAGGVPLTASQIAWPQYTPGLYPLPNSLSGPPVVVDQNAGRPGRQIQWSVGIQREIFTNLAAEVTYVGNRGAWWQAFQMVNYNALSPAILAAHGLSLNNPGDITLLNSPLNSPLASQRGFNNPPYTGFPLTATVAQSLRPFPQFNSGLTPIWAPLGDTWYHALQAKVTKRFSHGLQFIYNFTWQKSLTLGTENDTGGGLNGQVNDVFNRGNAKTLSGYDQTYVSTLALTYTLPKWNANKWLSYALSDWQMSPVLTYSSGLPILSPYAQNNLNSVTFQAANLAPGPAFATFANRVPGVPLFAPGKDPNCHCINQSQDFILNPLAWVDPPAGQFGTAAPYYNDYRYERRPVENFAFGRIFRIKERAEFNIRIEFNNIFNRTELPNPTSTNAKLSQTVVAGRVVSGFGAVNTSSLTTGTTFSPPRTGTLVARFQF
jgi:hypothetical protein